MVVRGRTRAWPAALAVLLALVGVLAFPLVASAVVPPTALTVGDLILYETPTGGAMDGIAYNASGVTLTGTQVKIGWAEDAARFDAASVAIADLAPGQWTTFHMEWPADVPLYWTPQPAAVGYEGATARVDLEVTFPAGPSFAIDPSVPPARTWSVTIKNPNTFPVKNLQACGVEWDGTALFDALTFGALPTELAAGASVQVPFYGPFDFGGVPAPQGRCTADKVEVAPPPPPPVDPPAPPKPEGPAAAIVELHADTLFPRPGAPVNFILEMKHPDGTPALNHGYIKLYYSTDGEDWSYKYFPTKTGVVSVSLVPSGPTYFKAKFWGDCTLGEGESEILYVVPTAAGPDAPKTPGSVKARRRFGVSGMLASAAKGAGNVVKIQCYRKQGRRWVLKATFTTNANAKGQYSAQIALKQRGTWRIRAYRPGAGNTKFRSLRVK